MSVADRNTECKPESPRTAEEAVAQIDTVVAVLKGFVVTAAENGESLDMVERRVQESVREAARLGIELFIRLQGDGDLGEEVVTEAGAMLRRSKDKRRTRIRTIFGEHEFDEYTYAPGCKKAVQLRSVSARLALPNHKWSHLLQEFSQMLAVDTAYGQTVANMEKLFGGTYSVDTAEKVNRDTGRAASAYLADPPKPDPKSEAKLLVASADCKGVPLVKADSARVAAFESAKKSPGNRRMATVASVYSVDPHVRDPEEITAALFREEPAQTAATKARPEPQNKLTTAHMPEVAEPDTKNELQISGIHVAMAWIAAMVAMRRRPGQVLIALMDGQASLWETMKLHFAFGARTIPVLDILHAVTYLWKAAALFEATDKGRREFTRARCLRLLRGEVRGVVQGLRQLATRRGLRGQAARDLTAICGYFENNADRMRYDEYLRRGYPIASGVIEGACRHLVKDRMERSGMRWTLEGARDMLHVRAAFQSAHWDDFLAVRIKNETETNHPHRKLLANYVPLTLAC